MIIHDFIPQGTVVLMLNHLKQVALHQAENKMTTANLAVCFGPIFVPPQHSADQEKETEASSMRLHIETIKYLLDIWPQEFNTNNNIVIWISAVKSSDLCEFQDMANPVVTLRVHKQWWCSCISNCIYVHIRQVSIWQREYHVLSRTWEIDFNLQYQYNPITSNYLEIWAITAYTHTSYCYMTQKYVNAESRI